jgi:uncharacterized membrane protein
VNETLLIDADSIVLGARDWWLASLLLVGIITAVAIWSYRTASRGRGSAITWTAFAVKLLAVAALGFCLLEPMRRTERPKPGANMMAVVVDNSRSMNMHPPGDPRSRVDRLRSLLSEQAAWHSRLSQDFMVRRYVFDDRLRATEDFEGLQFDGNSSSLADSLQSLQERFASRPVAGLMLVTDGIATDDLNGWIERTELQFPIYPIVDESISEFQDIAVSEASVTVSSFELAPATVEATVTAQGLRGRKIAARILDSQGKTLVKQTLESDSDQYRQRVRFQFQPSSPGVQFVQLRAMLESEDRDQAEVDSRIEVTTANNIQWLTVNRTGGPFRILYLSGRPNWEFKFLRRALEEDLELELSALIRLAKKEMKFVFGDRAVESTNRLFKGFAEDEETAEQHDETILIGFGKGPTGEVIKKFPATTEELFAYDAVVLDDIEASFFTPSQMLLMREFVASRGGGLMMLGGQESFTNGGYRDTPLGDVLPVYLRNSDLRDSTQEPVRYQLTREGTLEPWLRLRPTQPAERERLEKMPPFKTWNLVSDAKPGASVLVELETPNGMAPGLVTQQFGKGKSLALLIGDMWRWTLRRQEGEQDELAQNWRQIARWITNDVPRRVEADVIAPSSPIMPHQIRIILRDGTFKPLDNAEVKLDITQPDGKTLTTTAIADAQQSGKYLAEFWSQLDGGYLATIRAVSPDGDDLEPRNIGWTAQPTAAEFASLEARIDLLQKLAEQSGGEMVPVSQVERFVAGLPSRKVPVTEVRLEPLWHRPWLVFFAIACLCLEWGLRRWKGLP